MLAAVLLLIQRTETKRRLLVAGLLLAPTIWLIRRWAIYKDQIAETLWAAGIALAANVVFWLVYGRTHPPLSSDLITVIEPDDDEESSATVEGTP